MKRLILLGPTASGKSDTAIALARRLNGFIISADSRQVYKHLNIGTAKIAESDMQGILHLNISLLNPDEEDTAANFKKRSLDWEKEYDNQYNWVVYAGGSTLHLQSLLFPLDDIPPANEKNLKKFENIEKEKGLECLYKQLQQRDPDYAQSMDGINRQRLLRALDVMEQTGKPFSSFHKRKGWEKPENAYVFGLATERQALYDRINKRVDDMVENRLFDEYDELITQGYAVNAQALRTVGYREITQGRELGWSNDQIITKIKTNSRRYAKRQMTFFRRWPFINWISAENKTAAQMANEILDELKTLAEFK